ncbi:unnamed protein product [Prorocentrum cordatum]|nr:unnamed protein product [Polarella glacialis]
MKVLPAGPRVQRPGQKMRSRSKFQKQFVEGLNKLKVIKRKPKLDIRMGRVLARKLFEAKVRIRDDQYFEKGPSRVEDLPKQCATEAKKPDLKIKTSSDPARSAWRATYQRHSLCSCSSASRRR